MKVKLNIPQGYAFEITGDDGAPLMKATVAEYSFEADVDGFAKAITNLIEQFTPPRSRTSRTSAPSRQRPLGAGDPSGFSFSWYR
jgi:hypothetical protein